MLCTRCQSFCQSAAAQIQVLEKGTVRWGAHSAVHHRGLAQLQAASDARCPICRAVYFTPTEYERPALPESCVVVLELDPQDGAHPVLSTTFQDNAGGVLVPKRIVAIYSGFVDDGKTDADSLGFGVLSIACRRAIIHPKQMRGSGE